MKKSLFMVPAVIGTLSSTFWLSEPTGKAGFQVMRRPAIVTEFHTHQLSQQQLDDIAQNHCAKGIPALTPHPTYGPTRIRGYKGYAVELSLQDKIPLWVCEQVTVDDIEGDAKREGDFDQDKILPAHLQGTHDDYTNSGYARGHLAAAANRNSDQELKSETFLTTNIVPQNSSMNSGRWKSLETRIRTKWLDSERPVFIISGPIFHDPQEGSPETADGFVEYFSIGQGGVSVPTHMYKIVLQRQPQDQTQWRAIGFVMPNLRPEPGTPLELYITPISDIEDQTNINFFPDMDADTAWQEMESLEPEMWNQN